MSLDRAARPGRGCGVLWVFLLSYATCEAASPTDRWLSQCAYPWIASLGISFHLAVDGLSLLLLALTIFLGIVSVIASWTEIQEHVGAFHLALMLTLAGVLGVFMAVDLFLFYFFWELMLVPMYFLISIWGHENRARAAIKFFLFTQARQPVDVRRDIDPVSPPRTSHGRVHLRLRTTARRRMCPASLAFWLMLGFFVGFAVKLPVFGLHTWLPDAHTEAPTAGSVLLAGLLLKTGAYGLLRFALPLFPRESLQLAPLAMIAGDGGNPVWCVPGLRPVGRQTPGGVQQRQPSRLRASGHLRGKPSGPAGGCRGPAGARPEHGRPLHRRRHPAGTLPYPPDGRPRRIVVVHASPGRRGAVSGPGLAGPAGTGELRGRVPGAHGDIRRQSRPWRRSAPWDSSSRQSTRSG